MSNVTLFDFNETPVRVVIGVDGEPWWVAADVCRVLDHSNPSEALRAVDDEDRNTLSIAEGIRGNPNVNVVNESGLYALIFASRKPEARAFKRWVTKEVLPALRKTGRYALEGLIADPPRLAGGSDVDRLEAVQVYLFAAMAEFVAGKLSTRRLNAATKWAARIHEGLDRKWKREERQAIKEREQEDILALIDRVLFCDGAGVWEGRTGTLEAILTAEDSPVRNVARKVCGYASALGLALGRVQAIAPERVSRRVLKGYSLWRIEAPGEEVAPGNVASFPASEVAV